MSEKFWAEKKGEQNWESVAKDSILTKYCQGNSLVEVKKGAAISQNWMRTKGYAINVKDWQYRQRWEGIQWLIKIARAFDFGIIYCNI